MNDNLQVFQHENFCARSFQDDNGVIWVVAKDVATSLGYSRFDSNLIQNVPEIWKGTKRVRTLGGEQEMLCLTEQGLYFFLGRSDKKAALPYQMWIAGDVVPSIRKYGLYSTPQTVEKLLEDPDTMIKTLQALKAEREKVKLLSERVEADRPKVIFAEAVDASKESILIGDLAKLLKQNGYNIGQNRLFEKLRERGYLIKQKGTSWNMPTQRSMDMELFEIKERVIDNPDGSVRLTRTTKVTGKGQIYFVNKFLAEVHHD